MIGRRPFLTTGTGMRYPRPDPSPSFRDKLITVAYCIWCEYVMVCMCPAGRLRWLRVTSLAWLVLTCLLPVRLAARLRMPPVTDAGAAGICVR